MTARLCANYGNPCRVFGRLERLAVGLATTTV
jgi:hypothetical protein